MPTSSTAATAIRMQSRTSTGAMATTKFISAITGQVNTPTEKTETTLSTC